MRKCRVNTAAVMIKDRGRKLSSVWMPAGHWQGKTPRLCITYSRTLAGDSDKKERPAKFEAAIIAGQD